MHQARTALTLYIVYVHRKWSNVLGKQLIAPKMHSYKNLWLNFCLLNHFRTSTEDKPVSIVTIQCLFLLTTWKTIQMNLFIKREC